MDKELATFLQRRVEATRPCSRFSWPWSWWKFPGLGGPVREAWSLPLLAVILVVPMCLLCSVVGVIVARMDINIFTQIGFVVLVTAWLAKNAILIVEFARA